MPSSLIIVALVVAWLLVLVPIVARKRQEVARTADSTLAARVVRSGGVRSAAVEGESTMSDDGESDTERDDFDEYEADGLDAEDFDEADFEADRPEGFEENSADDIDADSAYDEAEYDDAEYDEYGDYEGVEARPYRPGRGGFDPEAAASIARARYTFRQRVVVLMLTAALVTGLVAGLMSPVVWWVHAAIDAGLVGYLGYLRRQVRIEDEIRQRRTARLGTPQRRQHPPVEARPAAEYETEEPAEEAPQSQLAPRRPLVRHTHPGTVVVDTDDEDPVFAELEEPGALPYRRAVGE
jgi:hypothetical protein